jgi:hypothetical protein
MNLARADTLSGIPIDEWVSGTVKRMDKTGRDDSSAWNRCWAEEYFALDGKSESVSTKPCPRAAARALWLLGRLSFGKRKFQAPSLVDVNHTLGKNATYALIAVDLLAKNHELTAPELWPAIQSRFLKAIGKSTAYSEKGFFMIVFLLHRAKKLLFFKPRIITSK